MVPSLCPLFCKQNSLPSGPGTRVYSALLLPHSTLPSWYFFLSQALSLGLNKYIHPLFPGSSLHFTSQSSNLPFPRAHTICSLLVLEGLSLPPVRFLLEFSLLSALLHPEDFFFFKTWGSKQASVPTSPLILFPCEAPTSVLSATYLLAGSR